MTNYEQKIIDKLSAKKLISSGKAEELQRKLKDVEGSLELMLLDDPNISSQDVLSAKSEISKLPGGTITDIDKISI